MRSPAPRPPRQQPPPDATASAGSVPGRHPQRCRTSRRGPELPQPWTSGRPRPPRAHTPCPDCTAPSAWRQALSFRAASFRPRRLLPAADGRVAGQALAAPAFSTRAGRLRRRVCRASRGRRRAPAHPTASPTAVSSDPAGDGAGAGLGEGLQRHGPPCRGRTQTRAIKAGRPAEEGRR